MDMDMAGRELDSKQREKLHIFPLSFKSSRLDSFQFHSIYGIRNCVAI